ncbi:MAG: CHRD domain-containing protein [Armatimonadetes bacterium]|nr:CHRD domain-containing protein [Armatimonadota bacterium]
MKKLTKFAFAAIIGAAAMQANATLWIFDDMLDGSQEVPPNGSPGTGVTTGSYDDITNMLMIVVVADNLTSNVTAAHIHNGEVGVAGPVMFPLTGATGSTTYNSNDMFTFDDAQEIEFLAGRVYVNIHTVEFPGGEIRGQINPEQVPEPATIMGILAGVALLAARRRTKR